MRRPTILVTGAGGQVGFELIRLLAPHGKVIGTERIRVPAGEFDTIRVRRTVYPGDHAFMLSETYVMETDWYAPALGRVVRTERDSRFLDMQSCSGFARCEARGDWDIYELVESRAAKR